MDPLAGTAEVMPAVGGNPPQCIPPVSTWQLVAQEGSTCYYFAPFAQRLNGYVTTMDNVGAVERLGGRCGVDEFNHDDAVCFNPGDEVPGAPSTTGLPVGIGISPPYNPYGLGTQNNPGPPGYDPGNPSGGSGGPIPGPAGGIGYKPSSDPCRPFGKGGYDYCQNPVGTRKPPGCVCGGPPLRTGIQNTPRGQTPVLKGSVTIPGPCKHFRASFNNKIILNNAQDLIRHIFDNYGTGRPIEITKVVGQPNTYLLVLAGTEFGTGQANMLNPAGFASAVFQPLNDVFQFVLNHAFMQHLDTYANDLHGLLMEQPLFNYVTSQLNVELTASQGGRTQYQADIVQAMMKQVPAGASVIIAGHSLGGMDGENLLANMQFRQYYRPVELITFGSPVTEPPMAHVKYVRYSSPNDVIRTLSLGTLISGSGKWIYVNNPGDDPIMTQFFQPGANLLQKVQAAANGLQAAHLNYTTSTDLAQYNVLDGSKSLGTSLLLDATDDNCYEAPNQPVTPAAQTSM
jgi:hypothetical protein